jgi:hypothetical protein
VSLRTKQEQLTVSMRKRLESDSKRRKARAGLPDQTLPGRDR